MWWTLRVWGRYARRRWFRRPTPHCKLHAWAWHKDGIGLYCAVCGFSTLKQNGFTGP